MAILEVPVTINRHLLPESTLTRILRRTGLQQRSRAFSYPLKPLWLRPSRCSTYQMIAVIKRFMARYRNMPVVVLNMMFHSMEFMPGKSPYAMIERHCRNLLNRIERVLAYCKTKGISFARLIDVYELYQSLHAPRTAL